MAEKIGFISFTAFELHNANEFDGIKQRLYNLERPTRPYLSLHPALPPWRQLALLGNEPILRRTPTELEPLMNEYHAYFHDKTIQHEHYMRWWRRHHAWNRDEEIFFLRFDDLRNHLCEVYNRETYARQGRMQAIFRKAAERSWHTGEVNLALGDRQHSESDRLSNHRLRVGHQYRELIFREPDLDPNRHRLAKPVYGDAQNPVSHPPREILHSPLAKPPRWAKLLAVAEYQQQAQIPLPAVPIETRSPNIKPPAMQPAPSLKGGKI